jgi:hypothetical protein
MSAAIRGGVRAVPDVAAFIRATLADVPTTEEATSHKRRKACGAALRRPRA